MSHFSLGVILNKKEYGIKKLLDFTAIESAVDRILEPFDENKVVDEYIQYTKEELIEKAKENNEEYKNTTYAEFLKDTKAYKEKYKDSPSHLNYLENEFPKVLKMTDEELYQREIAGYENCIDEDGNITSIYNPNSKWDWYEIGGRWAEMLSVGKEKVDYAVMTDINFNPKPTKEEIEEYTKDWNNVMNGKSFYTAEYYLERYGSLENYIKECSRISTFALLTPDGEWHEPGQMGYFGISTATTDDEKKFKDEYMNIINKYNTDNYIFVVVDCHI